MKDPSWNNTTVIEGDVVEGVRKLKEEPGGDIAVLGSGELAQTLMANDLVDEYSLTVTPIVLGNGKRLFRDPEEPLRLTLIDSTPTTTGCLLLTYRPTRDPANTG